MSVGPPTAAERARAEAAAEAARSSRAATAAAKAAAAVSSSSAPSSAAVSPASSCSSLAAGGSSQRPRSAATASLEAEAEAAAVGVGKPDDRDSSSSDAKDEESRSVGAVAWPVYRRYLCAAGPWMVLLAVSSLLLMQATRNGADVWLAAWVSSEDASEARAANDEGIVENESASLFSSSFFSSRNEMPESTRFYLAGLVVIAAANSVFALARAFSYALACLSACRRLHDQALVGVLSAPLFFYSSQPAGRLLNRFSADVTVADDDLPFVANVALASTAGLVGAACVMAGAQPVLLPCVLFPLWFVYNALRKRYSASARELRRLSAIAKSPVVTGVSDALGGGATLRSLPGAVAAAAREQARALAGAQRAALSSAAASQWLALRLQLIAAVVAGAAGVAAVAAHTTAKRKGGGLGKGEDLGGGFSSTSFLFSSFSSLRFFLSAAAANHGPGAVGLSLAYALPLTSLLGGALTAGAEAEQELVSVERLSEYCELEPQPQRLPPHQAPSSRRHAPPPTPPTSNGSNRSPPRLPLPPPPPATWPERGGVAFEDVWLRYVPRGPWALAGLTLSVPPGTSLGLAGRTGAGKSSLVSALLRLAETSAGGVRIDGHDVRCVPLRRLRAAVALVPQQPFVFRGTVRDNLDPLGQRSDVEMVSALKAARLWDVLAGLALAQRKASGAFSGSGGMAMSGSGGVGGGGVSSPRRNGFGGAFSSADEDFSDASDCEGGGGGASSAGSSRRCRLGSRGSGLSRAGSAALLLPLDSPSGSAAASSSLAGQQLYEDSSSSSSFHHGHYSATPIMTVRRNAALSVSAAAAAASRGTGMPPPYSPSPSPRSPVGWAAPLSLTPGGSTLAASTLSRGTAAAQPQGAAAATASEGWRRAAINANSRSNSRANLTSAAPTTTTTGWPGEGDPAAQAAAAAAAAAATAAAAAAAAKAKDKGKAPLAAATPPPAPLPPAQPPSAPPHLGRISSGGLSAALASSSSSGAQLAPVETSKKKKTPKKGTKKKKKKSGSGDGDGEDDDDDLDLVGDLQGQQQQQQQQPPWIEFVGDREAAYVTGSGFGAQILSVRLGGGSGGGGRHGGGSGDGGRESGDSGTCSLSMGQQQQLCLARAILRGCSIVCLDEATACCDARSAAALQAAIRDNFGGGGNGASSRPGSSASAASFASSFSPSSRATVIQIAHSLDSVLSCDAAAVVDAGVVVEHGPPGELLLMKGGEGEGGGKESVLRSMCLAAGLTV